MVGSITLAGQQQFDTSGRLLSGGKIYWIQAGTTSTPQNAFYDTGLTSPLPNPYTFLSDGRVPFHFIDDGEIKVRIVDSNGLTFFLQDNIPVLGSSSGGGGGGGVDPTTVFQTGDVMWLDVQGTRNGWVRDNGRTIGSAASGATERANADTSALFAYLWDKFSNTICPVSTGRGANAAADFAANKTITLPNKKNAVAGGLDDMGATAAGGFAGVPVVLGDVTTAGSVVGEATHTLTVPEIPSHNHTLTDPGHVHTEVRPTQVYTVGNSAGAGFAEQDAPTNTGSATTGITLAATGGGGAHNVTQKTVLGTFFRKL